MKTIIRITHVLAIILSSFFCTLSQNYQTFRSDRISYFEDQNKYVKCVRIDSVKFDKDSILYPFSNIRSSDDYKCFTPFGPSWIGRKIIIKSNGDNIFFNYNNDSITLKFNALANPSWVAYNYHDSVKILATVLSHDTLSFIGLKDSVKTIGFQAFDQIMNPVDHIVNTMKLMISKNYGIIKTFNFFVFPNLPYDGFPYEYFGEYDLIGISNPKTGVQNLTWFDVHDFNVGDELHVIDNSQSYGNTHRIETKSKYLERKDFKDSIVYSVLKKQNLCDISYENSTCSCKASEGIYKEVIYRNYGNFDKLPGEPFETSQITFGAYVINYMINSKPTIKAKNIDEIYKSEDSCYNLLIMDGCLYDNSYYKGLGGPYYSCEYGLSYSYNRELIYYKKGETESGNPLVFSSIAANNDESEVKVFPNPAKDLIYINLQNFSDGLIFELYNLNNQQLITKAIDNQETTINVSGVKPGLYFFKLKNNHKILKINKLIIE